MNPYEIIKDLARKKGMSIRELELQLGYSNGYFGKWRKVSPNSEGLKRVADFFGVSVDYLLGRKIPEKKSSVELSDDTVIMTYQGKPLSPEDRELILRLMRGK